MNKNIMLIAGCSHAAGSEIDGSCDSLHNRNNSFGNLLANKLGYTPVNIAVSGSANPGIVRSVLDWFNCEYDPSKNVFVLVGWTDGMRMEVPFYRKTWYNKKWDRFVDWYSSTHDNYIRINLSYLGHDFKEKEFIKNYHEFMVDNTLYLEILSATYILQLQYFLKMKKVKYLFVNSGRVFTQNDPTLDWYKNQIDIHNYLNPFELDESFYFKYNKLGYKNKKAEYYHHDEVPHKLYAEHLFDYITKQHLNEG